ncbi:MAG: LLM class flavin-dependent oxidoreductase [Miltoncostaeaceae bacterium]
MSSTRYIMAAAHEASPPGALLEQAAAAERAGFDAVCWDDGPREAHGPSWPWLGAAGALTVSVDLGTTVTADPAGQHPDLVARSMATMEAMFPGRTFLGLGSGRTPGHGAPEGGPGGHRPGRGMLEDALEIIVGLLDGDSTRSDGPAPSRRPPVYVSAVDADEARLAGRRADGMWTGADPERAPELIAAYREACGHAGRTPGEVIVQAAFAWSADEASAYLDADRWCGHTSAAGSPWGAPPVDLARSCLIVGPDPERHVERIRQIAGLGADSVVLTNISASDPLGAIETYGRHVLPLVRAEDARPWEPGG